MAKIIKVASTTTTPKTANLFRTSRNSTTNPFKYSNFEGNTLQFADVFEGFEPKNTSKLKIIAASVAGTMNKIRTGFEPIINFVNRIGSGITSAWNYAKNTNISDIIPLKSINEFINKPIEIKLINDISESVSGFKVGITEKIGQWTDNVTNIGKDMGEKWNTLISKINTKKINSDMSVAELEELWKNELALEVGGAV